MSSLICELWQGLAILPFVIFVATISKPVFALEEHPALPGQGPTDPQLHALVGRWEGRIDFKAGGPGGLRNYRTLVIYSIRKEHGQLVGRAEYGIPEAPLAPVSLQVEVLPRGIVNVRFMAPPGLEVNLTLVREDKLSGTTIIGKREPRAISFEKQR